MGKKIQLGFLVLFLILLVISYFVGRSDYPHPTEAYYINDYADALSQAARNTIMREGERLFYASEDENDGGAQVVFATFTVNSMDDVSSYFKTDLYRYWKIGTDDMGVLVLLFFTQDETTNELTLIETQIELGYRMEQYLTPGELGNMVDSSIYNEDYNWYLDMAVVDLLYQILEGVYVNAYGYESFSYDMDVYYDYLLDYESDHYIPSEPLSSFDYLFSSYISSGDRFFILLPYILASIFGGATIVRLGAGGLSGGGGIFRRN